MNPTEAHSLAADRPSVWIARCAERLMGGESRLEASDATDLATVLWDRERWRGDGPERAADRHLQSEAELAIVRRQAASPGLRAGALPHG
jgi:hypothetical protein